MKSALHLFLVLFLIVPLSVCGQFAKAYSVIAGSGVDNDAVEKITQKVVLSGFKALTIDFSTEKKALFRTCSGYFTSQQDAISHRESLKSKTGIKDAWVFSISSNYESLFNDLKEGNSQPEPEKQSEKVEKKVDPPVINSDPSKPPYILDTTPDNTGELDKIILIYNEISAALQKKKPELIEKFIDPEIGLIEIIDPSGIPYPIHSISYMQAVNQGVFISTAGKTPVKDFLPEFDCNAGMWTKTGAFISKVKSYSKISSTLAGAAELIYFDKVLLDAIEKMEYRISVVILATDESLLGFYQKEGNWYLGVIDNSFDCVE